ncbi:hypothetical protein [Paracoccus fistulariae]|uniref:Uncharacterized protein n=1 Tax=Paracoccus fistulariae TaxID=658446 RepID=A0ABY7SQN4_9RHOB|nr:hypothetical protein [Paracoccus fistulariae]MDB6183289.1 hypothetical protein [Paracoccus fistulariae]WCR09204.1 hypothetical protein JHX87_18080 [Paracoccus fistulariae]
MIGIIRKIQNYFADQVNVNTAGSAHASISTDDDLHKDVEHGIPAIAYTHTALAREHGATTWYQEEYK